MMKAKIAMARKNQTHRVQLMSTPITLSQISGFKHTPRNYQSPET
jgi:hypothetical protein